MSDYLLFKWGYLVTTKAAAINQLQTLLWRSLLAYGRCLERIVFSILTLALHTSAFAAIVCAYVTPVINGLQ